MFTLCVLFGKFCAAGAYKILYIATAELYPTAIRLTFLALLHMYVAPSQRYVTTLLIGTRCLASAPPLQGWVG